MKPHKHAKLIKAWADGAMIEMQCCDGTWTTCADEYNPTWDESVPYRIKPAEKVVRWQWIIQCDGHKPRLSSHFFAENEFSKQNGVTIIGKAEWTRTEFDE